MFEHQRRQDRDLAEDEGLDRAAEVVARAPGRQVRAALYEAALGRPWRKPGRLTWLPPPRTIAPGQAWQRIVQQGRVAASAASATVESEINAGGHARDAAAAAIAAAQDGGQPLPAELAERMKRTLGHDFGHVRIHTGAAADAAAKALGARAFTLAHHIYFADGELAPGTAAGDRLLRHELTHVVQFDHGRLAPRGGGLEMTEHHSAVEVEARAAETRSEPHVEPPAHEPQQPANENRGAGVAAASGAPAMSGALLGAVRLVSPRLATLLERGIEGEITHIVNDAIHAGISALIPHNPLAVLTAVGASITDIAATLVGAAQGDQKCCETFQRWCEKLGRLARKGATSQFIKDFKRGFDEVDQFVGLIVRSFGGALVDHFRGQLDDLRALGGLISTAVTELNHGVRAAADFVLARLRLPSVDAIEATLHRVAEAVFAGIKLSVAPAIAQLVLMVRALHELSGLPALAEALHLAGELVAVTRWLAAHRADEDIVRHAREQMAHTFLPRLLESTGGVVHKLQDVVAWFERHMTVTIGLALGAAAMMLGPLLPLAAAIAGIVFALRALAAAIGPTLARLWADAKALLAKLTGYARPVIDTLLQVATLTTNPWLAPVILASSAWLLLPECFKEPLINLCLDLILALLEASPSAVLLFGPLWRFVRAGAISFITQIRATWAKDDKIAAVNRLAHLGAGRNTEVLAGFVVGFFKGLVYGVIDPFKMVYELLKTGFEVTQFLHKLAARFPQLAAIILRYLPVLEARGREILAAGAQTLDDFLAGKIGFEELWALLERFLGTLEAKAGELGASAAGKLRGWILGGISDWDLGETLGIVVGFIVVFLLIAYFSAGISAEAEGALGVVRTIARILNTPYELLGAALKPLETLFQPVLSALARFGARVGLKAAWDGAMKAFERLATMLGTLVEELILAIEGKVAAGLSSLLEELTARVGAELAERLIAELGDQAAVDLVERLGAELVQQLGAARLTGPQMAHLAQVFEREGLELLLAQGLSGPELVRLGALEERVLRNLLLGLDAREVLALEEQIGADALTHLSDALTGPQIQAVVDTLGADVLEPLIQRGLTGAEIERLARLFERAGAEVLLADNLTGPELRRLLALHENTLVKLLAELDARGVLALEERFGRELLDATVEGLSARQIEDWTAKFGVDKFEELAEKYGGQALDHYGMEFFEKYQGLTPATRTHVIEGHGLDAQKGVKGTHDFDQFMRQYVTNPAPPPPGIHIHARKTAGALEEFEYSVMKADGSGPKAARQTKTTMHGLEGRWATLEAELEAALDAQIRDRTFPTKAGGGKRFSAGGCDWNYFFRDWHIPSVFPVL